MRWQSQWCFLMQTFVCQRSLCRPLAWLVQVKPLLTDTSIIRTHQPRSQGLSGTGETLGTRLHIFWTVHLVASFDPLSLKSDENEILFTLSLLVQTFK